MEVRSKIIVEANIICRLANFYCVGIVNFSLILWVLNMAIDSFYWTINHY